MTSVTDPCELVDVIIGVDTHTRTHCAAAINTKTGAVLDQITINATAEGYQQLTEFADQRTTTRGWAIEGTGSFGAGLSRYLTARHELVIELDRPVRSARRNGAKSDPIDAIRAGREALQRDRIGTPRGAGDHARERQSLSLLLAARRSAVEGAASTKRQLFGLIVTAPDPIRQRFHGRSVSTFPAVAIRLRIPRTADIETRTTITTLRTLAHRIRTLTTEATTHEREIATIVRAWRPDLLAQPGIGPIVAATILCAWSHPGRIHSEAAFAMLAGVAPLPASSGQVTTRYRINRRGDRHLNRALHTIVICRTKHDERTRNYIERRTSEGKTPREIRRCLKRYIARDLYRLLETPALA
ncbi:IS110 family transposase [Jongsikchunia kroppenstedtii]|uniref:IS110 family transposase n=1 Tax=Jongsikchunia kroppenstedtii TaxID=1121721 RepID=UPI0003633FED|nr:IS110 family transposase [Jongsikchunia kroppenstedtii]